MNGLSLWLLLIGMVAIPMAIGWALEQLALALAARRSRGLVQRGVHCEQSLPDCPVDRFRKDGAL